MAEEPDNLVLKILREMRGTLDEHTRHFHRLDARFAELKTAVDHGHAAASVGKGLWAQIALRTQAMELDLNSLKRRVDQLERPH